MYKERVQLIVLDNLFNAREEHHTHAIRSVRFWINVEVFDAANIERESESVCVTVEYL